MPGSNGVVTPVGMKETPGVPDWGSRGGRYYVTSTGSKRHGAQGPGRHVKGAGGANDPGDSRRHPLGFYRHNGKWVEGEPDPDDHDQMVDAAVTTYHHLERAHGMGLLQAQRSSHRHRSIVHYHRALHDEAGGDDPEVFHRQHEGTSHKEKQHRGAGDAPREPMAVAIARVHPQEYGARAGEIERAASSPHGLFHEDTLRGAYEGSFGDYTTKLHAKRFDPILRDHVGGVRVDHRSDGSKFSATGDILKHGEPAGFFIRHGVRDDDGHTVHHHTMVLDGDHQGGGFAHAFNRHAENHYIANGVKAVTLKAREVGGYSHARAGYDFYGPHAAADREAVRERVRDEIERRGGAHAGRLRREADAAHHAWEFATLGEDADDGHDHSIGKAALLGAEWHGRKLLDPKSRSYQVGEAYHAHRAGRG